MKVLYILGAQRGGSTIVGRLVGALPGFSFGGELRRLWERGAHDDLRCGCGADHATCPVWSVVLPRVGADAELARTWQRRAAPDRGSVRKLLALRARGFGDADSADSHYAALMGTLYREYAAASDARVVVDASKQPADAFVAANSGADVFVLHLVRDPRGVAYSLARRAERPTGAHLRQTLRAGSLWTGRNVSASVIHRALGPERFLSLNYEDLMAAPDEALARIAALVGEEPASIVAPDGTVQLPTAHTPTGNGRFVAQPTVVAEDRAWVGSLGPTDYLVATALSAPMRWRFGYRARRPKTP